MSGHQIALAAVRWASSVSATVRVGRPNSAGLMSGTGVRSVEAVTAVALVSAALAIRRVVQPEASAGELHQRFGAPVMPVMASTAWAEASARWRKPTPRQVLAAVFSGCAAGLFIGGAGGFFIGPIAGVAALAAIMRGASRAEQDRQRRLVASASAPADLFAASLSAGLLPADAAAVVAIAYGSAGPIGREAAPVAVIAERFAQSAQALRTGADPETAWRPLMVDSATAAVGAAALRSSRTGAPAARTAAAAAQACRVAARQAARAEIRAVAVRATAPLALCFLPAFVLVGIVPTALGLLAGLRT